MKEIQGDPRTIIEDYVRGIIKTEVHAHGLAAQGYCVLRPSSSGKSNQIGITFSYDKDAANLGKALIDIRDDGKYEIIGHVFDTFSEVMEFWGGTFIQL